MRRKRSIATPGVKAGSSRCSRASDPARAQRAFEGLDERLRSDYRQQQFRNSIAETAFVPKSTLDKPLPDDAVFFGEVGLSGEARSVGQVERRLAEARRLGFRTAFIPSRSLPKTMPDGLAVVGVEDVNRMMERLFR